MSELQNIKNRQIINNSEDICSFSSGEKLQRFALVAVEIISKYRISSLNDTLIELKCTVNISIGNQ